MITSISITAVFVKDIDESKAFYLDVLGFVEHTDITLGDGSYRWWCTVKHPSQPELEVHLTIPGPPYSPEMTTAIERALDEGGMFGLGLRVDDCRKTCDELRAKGWSSSTTPKARRHTAWKQSRATTRATGWSWSNRGSSPRRTSPDPGLDQTPANGAGGSTTSRRVVVQLVSPAALTIRMSDRISNAWSSPLGTSTRTSLPPPVVDEEPGPSAEVGSV